eukprot:SAG11_NODE_310_length_10927_cov_19.887514_7_plen_500_part_00
MAAEEQPDLIPEDDLAFKYDFWDILEAPNDLLNGMRKMSRLIDLNYDKVMSTAPSSTGEVKKVILGMIKKVRQEEDTSGEAKEWGGVKMTFEECERLYQTQHKIETVETVKQELEQMTLEYKGLQDAEVKYQTLLMKCLVINRKGQIDFGFEEDAYDLFVEERDRKNSEYSDYQVCEDMIIKHLRPVNNDGDEIANLKETIKTQKSDFIAELKKTKNTDTPRVKEISALKKKIEEMKGDYNPDSVWKEMFQEATTKNAEMRTKIRDIKRIEDDMRTEYSKEIEKLRGEVQKLQGQVRKKDETLAEVKSLQGQVREKLMKTFTKVTKTFNRFVDDEEQSPPKTQTFKRKSCPSMSGGGVPEKKQRAVSPENLPSDRPSSADDYNYYHKKLEEYREDVPVFFHCWIKDKENHEKLLDMANQLNNDDTLRELSLAQIEHMYMLMNPVKTTQSFKLIGKLASGPRKDTDKRRTKMKEHILDWCERAYAVAKGDLKPGKAPADD